MHNRLHIVSPNSRTTEVTVDALPSWAEFSMTVKAYLSDEELTSTITTSYGTNAAPQVSFDMDAPEIVFVNDDGRTSRWYRVSLSFSCAIETNATFSLEHNGSTGILFSEKSYGTQRCTWSGVQSRLSSLEETRSLVFYIACADIGEGTFTASCRLPGGEVINRERKYKVIEPLRRLVNTGVSPDGGYYNPSRLVYGTNAWLRVGVVGDYDYRDVGWRVVSGPARITETNGWAVSVEPTASSGEVVVEAAFGRDSSIQPRFVLPVVESRLLSVKAFVVGSNGVSRASILRRIDYANRIFSQVGLELNLVSVSDNVGLASDYVVAEYDQTTNAVGRVSKVLSRQARRLLDTYSAGDCLELYFVNAIVNGTAVAFHVPQGIIISNRASDHVIAHEIGHSLGLEDCYAYRRGATGRVWIDRRTEAISEGFMSRSCDWGLELKRGFYADVDSRELTLYKFLMYGVDGKDGVDIPSANVLSLKRNATLATETKRSAVGADYIKQNDSEVYSR